MTQAKRVCKKTDALKTRPPSPIPSHCGPRPQRRTGNQGFGVAPGVGPEPGTTHDADVSQRLLSEPLNHPVGMACEAPATQGCLIHLG